MNYMIWIIQATSSFMDLQLQGYLLLESWKEQKSAEAAGMFDENHRKGGVK